MDELIDKAAENLDEVFNFNEMFGGWGGALAESADRPFFKAILTLGNKKIPESARDEWEIIVKALGGDFANFSVEVADRLNAAINIPGLNEQMEGIFFRKNMEAFVEIAKLKAAA